MGYDKRSPQPEIRQFDGLNTVDAELGMPGFDSPSLLNVDLHPNGAAKSRSGFILATSPSEESRIDAIFVLPQPDLNQWWIYALVVDEGGTRLYRSDAIGEFSDWIEITQYTPMSLVPQLSWGSAVAAYADDTYDLLSALYTPRSNGAPGILLGVASPDTEDDVIVMPEGVIGDGGVDSGTKGYPSTWTSGNWPTHMRTIGLGHGTRLYAWGLAGEPNKVYYSEIDVPWNYLRSNVDDYAADAQPGIDGGYFFVESGSKVISVVDMFSYVVVFTETTCSIFTGDPGDTDWTLRAVFPVGIVGDKAWEKVGNDLYFWSQSGPRMLSAVQEYGDLAQGDPAFKITPSVSAPMPGSTELVKCYHDRTNGRVIFLAPLGLTDRCDTAFVYYYYTRKWSKWNGLFCQLLDVVAIPRGDQQPERFVGASYENGLVLLQVGNSDGGNDIAAYYETAWINFGSLSDQTRILWNDMFYLDQGAGVDIDIQRDLAMSWERVSRIIRSFASTGSSIGYATIGVDAIGVPGRAHLRFEIDLLLDMMRLKFSKTGQTGWGIMGYRIEAREKGARA